MMPKQVIVVRSDLKMRKGKLAAQVAHASMKALLNQGDWNDSDSYLISEMTSPLVAWLRGSFTKIVAKCESEGELFDIFHRAQAEGVICSIIQDNGDTVFNGEKTYTTIAIGPEDSEILDRITGDLKLL